MSDDIRPFKPNGAMACNEWYQDPTVVGDKRLWYHADGSQTYQPVGTWVGGGSTWYFGDKSGWWAKNSTYKIDDRWYQFDSSGLCIAEWN